ncbi:egg cell-secreted protein 1.1-like, partial [Asparagus officinalis]|uniref:egg cell-secreted protein 1.1-like n=1 Tax=Asparagus officinalis TaxID=4686 RepID=UPI00098E2B17
MIMIVFLLAAAATATPSPSPQPAVDEFGTGLSFPVIPLEEAPSLDAASIDDVKFALPFIDGDVSVKKCWNTIVGVEGCAGSLLESLQTLQIKIGPKCCHVIKNIGDKCFHSLFDSLPFNPS